MSDLEDAGQNYAPPLFTFKQTMLGSAEAAVSLFEKLAAEGVTVTPMNAKYAGSIRSWAPYVDASGGHVGPFNWERLVVRSRNKKNESGLAFHHLDQVVGAAYFARSGTMLEVQYLERIRQYSPLSKTFVSVIFTTTLTAQAALNQAGGEPITHIRISSPVQGLVSYYIQMGTSFGLQCHQEMSAHRGLVSGLMFW